MTHAVARSNDAHRLNVGCIGVAARLALARHVRGHNLCLLGLTLLHGFAFIDGVRSALAR